MTKQTKDGQLLKLKHLKRTAVRTKTEKEFNKLMRVYEYARWHWCSRLPPTMGSGWNEYGTATCVDSNNKGNRISFSPEEFYREQGYKIISLREFYKLQRVIPRQTLQINRRFDERGY